MLNLQASTTRRLAMFQALIFMVLLAFSGKVAAQGKAHDMFPPLDEAVGATILPDGLNRRGEETAALGKYQHLLGLIPPARNLGPSWEIYSTEWTEADEVGFEAFVTAIGRSGCVSLDDCLRSDANPFRDMEDEELWLGDCTDMAYVLRGYYAWKRGLPFSFEEAITARQAAERGDDLRYTSGGNRITSRFDVTHPQGRRALNAPRLLRNLFNVVSTAMLRTHPEDTGRAISSFYPVTVSRDAVRPGAIVYDVYGHVSIVYDVPQDGRIMMVSSHPDYTVSRSPYGAAVMRTGPELGSGIRAWRPAKIVGATKTSRGTYVGGRIVLAGNETLADFSLEQYFGTHPDETGEWQKGRYILAGRTVPFHTYVQLALRDPALPFDPLQDMASAVDALCDSVRARRTAVNMAVYAGIPNRDAPERLPPNIYGTYGDWERYATPSRDARLKTQAWELRLLAERLLERAERGDATQQYVSHDLAAALLDVYSRGVEQCKITYKRSDATVMRLTLQHVLDRLFDLSFDPFHCPERRWGATGYELQTCPDDAAKRNWYDAQRYLRYDPQRTYDLVTDFTADQLGDPSVVDASAGGIGRSAPPDVDVKAYLEARAGGHPTANAELPMTMLDLAGAINAVDAPPEDRRRRRRVGYGVD